MRTKIVLKNSLYSIASYIILFTLGLINRKVFLNFLSVEFLGYEGLFTNIFSLLSLAELGVGSVITYNLYHEIVSQNELGIAKLMTIYKYVYRLVGSSVILLGIIIFPLLKFIIVDNVTDWKYIQCIYIIQLISTASTYFLAYRRILFIANQMEFVCIKIDTIASGIGLIIRIIILVFTRNYLLYLLLAIIQNISTNIIISRKYGKSFSFIKKVKVNREDFQKIHFFKDISNFAIHKISYFIYEGVDNVIITIILGISTVGLFSNYMLIKTQVWNIINKLLKPLQATIGNLIYSEEGNEKGTNIFFMCDTISFFLASFVSITLFVMFQPFIELWIGKQYLQSLSLAFLIALNIYIGIIHEVVYYFRSAFGKYEKDRIYMILAAVINLGLSIMLAKKYGLSGIMFGTDVGLMFIWYGRIKVVFQNYLHIPYKKYIFKQISWIILVGLEGILTYWLASHIQVSLFGLIGKLLICMILPNSINLLIFFRTENFKRIKQYLYQITNTFKVNIGKKEK
jgi:O-antigen/teichoic acid export membrane protein